MIAPMEAPLFQRHMAKTARMQEDQLGTILVVHRKPMAGLDLFFHG